MTTKQDLIDGFRLVVREARRVTSRFSEDDWAKPVQDEDGWDRKQTYCHIAASAEIAPAYLTNLANAGEGENPMANFDINAYNAQMVAAKASLSPQELVDALTSSYEKLIAFTESMPQEQLDAKRDFGLLRGGTVADVMDSVLVVHAVAHIYHAGANAA